MANIPAEGDPGNAVGVILTGVVDVTIPVPLGDRVMPPLAAVTDNSTASVLFPADVTTALPDVDPPWRVEMAPVPVFPNVAVPADPLPTLTVPELDPAPMVTFPEVPVTDMLNPPVPDRRVVREEPPLFPKIELPEDPLPIVTVPDEDPGRMEMPPVLLAELLMLIPPDPD